MASFSSTAAEKARGSDGHDRDSARADGTGQKGHRGGRADDKADDDGYASGSDDDDHGYDHEEAEEEPFRMTWAAFRRHPLQSIRQWWAENSGRFKAYVRNYGPLTLTAYFALYLVVLGSFWGLVELGTVKGPDVNKWINNSRIKHAITEDEIHLSPYLTNFLTAWLLTKTTEPFRMGAILFIMPALLRYLPLPMLRVFGIRQRPTFAGATKRAHAARRVLHHARHRVREATSKRSPPKQ